MIKGYPWTAIYDEFEKIAYRIINEKGLSDETCAEIEKDIYLHYYPHIGEEAWDIAYTKWTECIND